MFRSKYSTIASLSRLRSKWKVFVSQYKTDLQDTDKAFILEERTGPIVRVEEWVKLPIMKTKAAGWVSEEHRDNQYEQEEE
jgi:hypothetical protein